MSMDDYYDLLGVEPDAPVSDIRAAYRDKKAAVADRDTADAKADAAALNKAWNVLSDPYQRGRYDQQRGTEFESDDGNEAGDDIDVPPARTRTSRTDAAQARKGGRPLPSPTVTLPAGVAFPATRARVTAMLIDLFVLVVLFAVSAYVTDAVERSQQPRAHHEVVSVLPDQIKNAHSATGAAKKQASAKVDCTKPTTGKDKVYCDAKAKEDALNKAYDDQTKKLAPIRTTVSGVYFLVALLVLLIPSLLLGGATLGKRLQKIRVSKLDGSRAGAGELFRRYGLLAFSAFVLSLLLQGPIGALVVVFVATLWTRNPNRQGLHDRFARTLVVTGQPA